MHTCRVVIAGAALLISAAASAGLHLDGSLEINYIYDQGPTEYGDKLRHGSWDVGLTVNAHGETQLGSLGQGEFRIAQKGTQNDRRPGIGSREAWLGLSGGWGGLRAGRQFLNSYLVLDWPYGQGGFWELAERDLGNWAGGGKATANVRMAQSLNYLSPQHGAWRYAVQYGWSAKANQGAQNDGAVVDLSAEYKRGDLVLNSGLLGARGLNNFDGATQSDDRDRQFYLGALYPVAPGLMLRGLVTAYRHRSSAGDVARGSDWLCGMSYTLDKHVVKLAWLHRADQASALTAQKDFDLVKAEYGYQITPTVLAYLRLSQKRWGGDSIGASQDYRQILTGVWTSF